MVLCWRTFKDLFKIFNYFQPAGKRMFWPVHSVISNNGRTMVKQKTVHCHAWKTCTITYNKRVSKPFPRLTMSKAKKITNWSEKWPTVVILLLYLAHHMILIFFSCTMCYFIYKFQLVQFFCVKNKHINNSLSIFWLSDHAQYNWRQGCRETMNIFLIIFIYFPGALSSIIMFCMVAQP